jgi:hypothetical protein
MNTSKFAKPAFCGTLYNSASLSLISTSLFKISVIENLRANFFPRSSSNFNFLKYLDVFPP